MSALRTLAFILLTTWAAVQGSLSLWSFRQDAARRDFGYFVHSARMWRETGVLYENVPRVNLNPPHTSILLFTPLTWMPFDAAATLWTAVQIATLAVALFLIARELHLSAHRLEWIVPLTVLSAMTTHNWIEGQVGGILLIGGALAWRAARRDQQGLASAILGGLLNLKPQFVVILLAMSWRDMLRITLVGAMVGLAGVLLTGPGVWLSWVETTRVQGLQLLPWNVSIAPMIYRSGAAAAMPLLYAVAALALVVITWRTTVRGIDIDRAWLLWGIVALLIAPVSWVYYAGAILGPLIAWGERHHWPKGAKIGIVLWLIPLHAMFWAASSEPGWRPGLVGSPYTLGAVLVWLSALAERDQHQIPSGGEIRPVP